MAPGSVLQVGNELMIHERSSNCTKVYALGSPSTSFRNRGLLRSGSNVGSTRSQPGERWYGIRSSGSSRSEGLLRLADDQVDACQLVLHVRSAVGVDADRHQRDRALRRRGSRRPCAPCRRARCPAGRACWRVVGRLRGDRPRRRSAPNRRRPGRGRCHRGAPRSPASARPQVSRSLSNGPGGSRRSSFCCSSSSTQKRS